MVFAIIAFSVIAEGSDYSRVAYCIFCGELDLHSERSLRCLLRLLLAHSALYTLRAGVTTMIFALVFMVSYVADFQAVSWQRLLMGAAAAAGGGCW